MRFIDKLRITSNKTYTSPTLKRHESDFFCNKWWCHRGRLDTINLSDIKTDVSSVRLKPHHAVIEYNILDRGYDYNMGYIVVNKNNRIMDGYHRVFILRKHFDDSYKITVLKLPNVGNIFPVFILKMSIFYLISKVYTSFYGRKEKGRVIELDL